MGVLSAPLTIQGNISTGWPAPPSLWQQPWLSPTEHLVNKEILSKAVNGCSFKDFIAFARHNSILSWENGEIIIWKERF